MTVNVDLDHLAEVVFFKCLPLKLLFPPIPYCILGEKVTMSSPYLRSGKFFSSLRVEYPHKLLEILLQGRFISSTPFIYLFNHLFISLWTRGFLYFG